jgi:hypothetical protein
MNFGIYRKFVALSLEKPTSYKEGLRLVMILENAVKF